jgi:hypothetical protein
LDIFPAFAFFPIKSLKGLRDEKQIKLKEKKDTNLKIIYAIRLLKQ